MDSTRYVVSSILPILVSDTSGTETVNDRQTRTRLMNERHRVQGIDVYVNNTPNLLYNMYFMKTIIFI